MHGPRPRWLAPFALLLSCGLFGCAEPPPGAPVAPPYFVDLDSGDPRGLAKQQMGLLEPRSVSMTGDFPFEEASVACGPAAPGPHPDFLVFVTARNLELTLIVPDHVAERHEGERQVQAVLGRVGTEGGYLEADGVGTASLRSTSDRAGAFAVSGTFQVDLSGAAGHGAMSGSFEGCYYFT